MKTPDKYMRVTVTVEWGSWHETIGKVQSRESHGTVCTMPATIDEFCILVKAAARGIGDDLSESLHRREFVAKDVMQPKNYGPKVSP